LLKHGHAAIVDAPPTRLFVENTHAVHAVASAAALALAAAAIAWLTRESLVRLGATIASGVLALYAGSLLLVSFGDWDWDHVAVSGLLAVTACALVWRHRTSALAVIAANVALVAAYDLPQLGDPQRWWACAPLAGAALVVAIGQAELVASLLALLPGALFATVWIVGLLENDAEGYGLLGVATVYVGVAFLLRRRRDFASALAVVAFMWSLAASLELLHGTWLVLAWALAAAGLALLARFEQRLEYPSLAFAGCGLVYTLAFAASPAHLFVAQHSPGAGTPSLALVAGALFVFAARRPLLHDVVVWVAGALTLYAASLTIVQIAERAGGSVDTAFQRGHTGISALWAVVGAGLLVVGIRSSRRRFQFGGLALFGLALAKLFLYDLSFLSSITRAFSFLAVGAMLLAAGFTYQRVAGPRAT
jgi:hypothetical protein